MTRRRADRPGPVGGHLYRREEDRRAEFWTEALGDPPAVYGERIAYVGDRPLRRWDPYRSKLGAALARGWTGPLPSPGERWLYLGAATGTTASHVADLVGREGRVYAVERSLRPFARLLALGGRYPNLLPVLADARRPEAYLDRVPLVDGLYLDVAQPDQVDLALANARLFLRGSGALLLALKTSSMGREKDPRRHRDEAEDRLEGPFEIEETIALEPFHKRHFLLGGRPTRALVAGASAPPVSRRAGPRAERRR